MTKICLTHTSLREVITNHTLNINGNTDGKQANSIIGLVCSFFFSVMKSGIGMMERNGINFTWTYFFLVFNKNAKILQKSGQK